MLENYLSVLNNTLLLIKQHYKSYLLSIFTALFICCSLSILIFKLIIGVLPNNIEEIKNISDFNDLISYISPSVLLIILLSILFISSIFQSIIYSMLAYITLHNNANKANDSIGSFVWKQVNKLLIPIFFRDIIVFSLMILLVLPGIVASIFLSFVESFIVIRQLNISASMSSSIRLAKINFKTLLLLFITLQFIPHSLIHLINGFSGVLSFFALIVINTILKIALLVLFISSSQEEGVATKD